MNRFRAGKNTDAAMAKLSCLANQSSHHRVVCLQQIINGKRIQIIKQIISSQCVFNFLNFPQWSDNLFPVQNV